MPTGPVPAEYDAFLQAPNPAVIATLRPDGSPHTAATWYLWRDGRLLLNMEDSRARLGYLRRDPRLSLTVLDEQSWYRQVTLEGVVDDLHVDDDMSVIDEIARHYTGQEYRVRDRPRVSAWVRVERWHAWDTRGRTGARDIRGR